MAVISLKEQLFSSDRMIGTFIKTPNYQIVEIVTSCNLSFVALDAEHAPFSKSDLDTCSRPLGLYDNHFLPQVELLVKEHPYKSKPEERALRTKYFSPASDDFN